MFEKKEKDMWCIIIYDTMVMEDGVLTFFSGQWKMDMASRQWKQSGYTEQSLWILTPAHTWEVWAVSQASFDLFFF